MGRDGVQGAGGIVGAYVELNTGGMAGGKAAQAVGGAARTLGEFGSTKTSAADGVGGTGPSRNAQAGNGGDVSGAAVNGALAGQANCDPTLPFTSVVSVGELNTGNHDDAAHLTPDQLTIYFTRQLGSNGVFQVFTAARRNSSEAFSKEVSLPLHPDSSSAMIAPYASLLFYNSDLADPNLNPDLFVSTFPFSGANSRALVSLNTEAWEYAPYVSADGEELYYVQRANETAKDDIMVATYESGDYVSPRLLTEVNLQDYRERGPVLSHDGLRLYFASDRLNSSSNLDIFMATRERRAAPFTSIVPVMELNGSGNDQPDWISADECTLYFRSDRLNEKNGRNILRASRR